MKHFFLLIFFSFWGGVLVAYLPLYKRLTRYFFVDFLKGAIISLSALFLVGTPMSLIVAAFGLLAGNLLFPFPRERRKETIYGTVSGVLLFMAPDLFLLLCIWGFSLYLLQRRFVDEIFVSYFLVLPLLMYLSGKSDVYILFSSLVFLIVFIDNLEKLEDGIEQMLGKARWKFFHNREIKLSFSRKKILRQIGYSSLVLLLVLAFFLNRYVYRGFGMQVELFRKGPEEIKVVALTFDDGPDPRFTPYILDILNEQEVKATFFMVGKHVERYPHIARQVAEAGHEIGNHTYNHHNLLQANSRRVSTEISRGEEAIISATGMRPSLFRPPRGLYDARVMDEARDRGYTVVLWSLSSRDWLELRQVDITRGILQNVSNGEIILFHDSGNLLRAEGGERLSTVLSLRPTIEGLKEQGYFFVTITELMILSGISGNI
ncbi:MAG: polysaccharide deacetylase family protein [Bacillota bacterium]|nr:polysaccharide deacetylase family protein [Bacillota bacterium]